MTAIADQIKANAARIAAENSAIPAKGYETVTVADLAVGDLIVELGVQTFPFPFDLSSVRKMPKRGLASLTATHGWFTARAVRLTDTAVRVVR